MVTPRYSSAIFGTTSEAGEGNTQKLMHMAPPSMNSTMVPRLHFTGSLEEAQFRKVDTLLRRAQLTPEHRLLDIGFGWGGLAIRAAMTVGCRVHGITLSKEQKALAEERVRARGLEQR